jgi:hypothetical protein
MDHPGYAFWEDATVTLVLSDEYWLSDELVL